MRKVSAESVLGISGVLALAIVVTLVLNLNSASAQSPGTQSQLCCQDMWDPNWMQRDMWGPGKMGPGMRQRMERHRVFMHEGIPVAYRGARNSFSSDAKTIGEGRALYRENCASCHGAKGMGDGEGGKSLSPSPALLANLIEMPMSVDEFLLWSISDGGTAFGTAMPAFKDVLTRDEIWKIVTYMRAGFPVQ
ncbi:MULTISPECIES: c-type cytochrome [unclassified Sneathiella]|jgi:mono/diheme cytochrome c family protein|uniref:c-type cytochrome n=1 Tax=unclassified Sneathiella TaxID=2614935 RepID=UPI00187B227D|nr:MULTISPECIES: c-type cytochrome [unclassified Sneathiella]MBE7638697.1 c-type cytochrome [Sneathiella sp. P13V-1]MBO6827350.1 c-type cytochrome [Sneathiella sp.]MCC3306042.1 c-type cytochrome [Sneathiella sp. HT1-7]